MPEVDVMSFPSLSSSMGEAHCQNPPPPQEFSSCLCSLGISKPHFQALNLPEAQCGYKKFAQQQMLEPSLGSGVPQGEKPFGRCRVSRKDSFLWKMHLLNGCLLFPTCPSRAEISGISMAVLSGNLHISPRRVYNGTWIAQEALRAGQG